MQPEDTVNDFLDIAARAVRGAGDKTADFVRGSDYESLSGPCAMIWSRESLRDTDLFRAIRFNDADGDDLTNMVKLRYGIDRILDTRGAGTAFLARPSAGLAGTIWQGTRIVVRQNGDELRYRVTADTAVSTSALSVSVPIEALDFGPGTSISTTIGLFLDDATFDAWTVTSLACADGTEFEPADDLRARVRASRHAKRVGHEQAIIDACVAAGAANVVAFRSDYGGDSLDVGLNVCYVGDSGYSATPKLVRACAVALRAIRVLGDNMQVLPMARVGVNVDADVTLNDSPARFDTTRLYQIHRAELGKYIGGQRGRFSYTKSGLISAIARPTPVVQDVSFVLPTSDTTVLSGNNFPDVLARYVLGTVVLRYRGP